MNGQVEESSTWNFKVIRQGHVIYFNIFGIEHSVVMLEKFLSWCVINYSSRLQK